MVHAEFSPATVQDQATSYAAVAAAGTDNGFVAGSTCSPKCTGIFARTTDGGAQWRVGSTGAVLGTTLAFSSASDGFLLGNLASSPACGTGGLLRPCHVLLSTTDAGRHWSAVGRDLPPIWSMTFVSPLVGFVAVDACKASSSSEPVPPAPCRGRIERTVDAGMHWTTVLQTAAPVIALTSSGRTIWAVEARTSANSARATSNWVRVLHSTNDGQSWAQLGLVRPRSELPIPSDIAAQIVFASANFGAITLFSSSTSAMHGCGLDEVLTTADGGEAWSSATLPGTFFGCGTPIGAVAAGPHGNILVNLDTEGQCPVERDHVDETSDGGRTWHLLRTAGFAATPTSMVIPSAKGWAVSSTAVLRTVDAGLDWTQVLPASSPVNGIDFVSSRMGFGWGTIADPGALLATSNGGRTWRQVSAIGSEVLGVDFTDAVHGWALVITGETGGGTAEVLTTADGGIRWEATAPLPDNTAMTLANLPLGPGALQAISIARARIVVPSQASAVSLPSAASRPNLLLDTSNGGRAWTVTKLSVGAGPVIATSFAGRGGWLVSGAVFPGCPATLDATLDAGSHWSVLASVPTVGEEAPSTPGYDIEALSPDAAWLWLTRFGDALGEPEALVLATGLLKTLDRGHTWTRYLLPRSMTETRLAGAQWPVGLGPVAVQFLPGQPAVGWMLVGTDIAPGAPTAVQPALWRTTDGGRRWAAVS